MALIRHFKVKVLTLTCQARHRKASSPTTPTLPVGLLLTKGVKFKFKAFLVNTLRTQEPPQLLASWRRCHAQQLLRWSAETTELPSARRQPQQPGPQLCKLLSESITRPGLFGREAKSPASFCNPTKRVRAALGHCSLTRRMGCGRTWLHLERKRQHQEQSTQQPPRGCPKMGAEELLGSRKALAVT